METPPGRPLAYQVGARHQVPIIVRLIDVGAPQGEHAIVQHAASTAVEEAGWHTALIVFAGRDAIQAILREERRPALEVILVDAATVGRDQMLYPANEVVVLRHDISLRYRSIMVR